MRESNFYGLSQRPIAAAFGEKNGHPAWKDLPAWAAVGTEVILAGPKAISATPSLAVPA
jgi:hypothetical protein